jgi:hypothetical protein
MKEKWYKKVWRFLDGSKRNIGLILVTAGELVPDPLISKILTVSGMIIGGTGLIQKATEKVNEYKKKEK